MKRYTAAPLQWIGKTNSIKEYMSKEQQYPNIYDK